MREDMTAYDYDLRPTRRARFCAPVRGSFRARSLGGPPTWLGTAILSWGMISAVVTVALCWAVTV